MGSTAIQVNVGGERHDAWKIITALVLNGISSRHTRRSYSQALEEFLIWFLDVPGRLFNKATVQQYRTELEIKGLAASSINVRLSAIRRLAQDAADNGLMDPTLAAGIERAEGAKRSGVRLGHWLTVEQTRRLLEAPDLATVKGVRDAGILSLLLGAGLRRSEVAVLNCEHVQYREGRWLIGDLVGKHGRIRTVPIPLWAYEAIARWQTVAAIADGPVFRRVDRHGHVSEAKISPQAVFDIVKGCAQAVGIDIAPHDLRRTFAHMAHAGKAPLEQIQLSLGHASVVTTELYLGVKQNLRDAPCDHLGIRVQRQVADQF